MKNKFEEYKNSSKRTECFFGTIEEYEKIIKSNQKDDSIVSKIRYTTKEEQDSVNDYINKISTSVPNSPNFFTSLK